MSPLLLVIIAFSFLLNQIYAHFHETQLPKSYGDVQQLTPLLNLSYSPPGNLDISSTTTIPGEIIQITTYTNSFAVEDDSIEKPLFVNADKIKSSNVIQFIWTVYNFSDILYSDQELIFSPRFYLTEPGFRFQMLLITNTTYSDMVSYLGVFFRIVAGDYDSEVEWPYKHLTVLSVLKHEELDEWTKKAATGIPRNLCTKYNYTIIPNIDECRLRSAFLRPNSDVEYSSITDGCGNRRHVPLSALESDRYLKDDTLIVLLTVHLDSDSEEKSFHKAIMSMRYNELVSNYLWTIERFNQKKNESVSTGKIVILNAEPFYTHPNGYLIQLFLTILPKRSAFAISIAFVQGDHDRYLQWPFPYPFEMAIVDQSPDYWKRDLTVKVKPSKSDCGTEPFGQPGPQPEFCFLTIQSLQVLSLTHYNFLLNDTLKIRFTTRFERYSSRQRSSILLRNNRLVSEFNWLIPGLVARFQRYINEQNNASGNLTSNLLHKTHHFVSDEFYTNGQGYLCQLILTVSIRNLPRQQKSTDTSNRTISTDPTTNLSQQREERTQDILVFSLELVIIEGEYDRFLEWPFNNAYELAIVGYKDLSGINVGGQLYFDKSTGGHNDHKPSRINSKLIVPLTQVENGQCSKEAFQKPIKQNPPCGIKEFVQMDIGNDNSDHGKIHKQKSAKDATLINDNNDNGSYELGSLSKTDEDLHLRVRIYL